MLQVFLSHVANATVGLRQEVVLALGDRCGDPLRCCHSLFSGEKVAGHICLKHIAVNWLTVCRELVPSISEKKQDH